MIRDAISTTVTGLTFSQSDFSNVPPALPAVPRWWLGSGGEFKRVHDARLEIHQHGRSEKSIALTVSLAGGLATFSIAGLAAGELTGQGIDRLLSALSILMILAGAWIFDRRLMRQLLYAKQYGLLANRLVAATKLGCVDLSRDAASRLLETEPTVLLRKDLNIVAQYLASQENHELALSLFRNGLVLRKVSHGFTGTFESRWRVLL